MKMVRITMATCLALAGLAPTLMAAPRAPAAPAMPAMPAVYKPVVAYLGKKADFKDKVLKVNIPRSDLKMTVDGVATPTPFGFGGWIAMTHGTGGRDVMMGDLVLTQEEVNPVMSALLNHGLEVTALHNHFFWEEPRVFFMHVHGMGRPMDLARKVKPALDLIGHVPAHAGSSSGGQARNNVTPGMMDTARLSRIVGAKGEQTGQVYKITLPRKDLRVTEMGAVINARMGLNTWAAFFGSDQRAVVAGDIAMTESEVTPVLKALRGRGLQVVAIHHHMIGSRPMIIFLHYWGEGPAPQLAQGFRAAVNQLGRHGRMGTMRG